MRVEDDWLRHCARWETRRGPQLRDNCLTNTDNLRNVLAIEGVRADRPLYVAGELEAASLGATRGLGPLLSAPEPPGPTES